MDTVKNIILRKPTLFVIVSCIYFVGLGLLKWKLRPPLDAMWFFLGGGIGLYFLDAAELFFQLNPSPFRSVIFSGLFTVVSLFIVTSSGSTLASGLVLSLYLQMILWQVGEWRIVGNISSWYRMVALPVPFALQRTLLGVFAALFLLESYFFIH